MSTRKLKCIIVDDEPKAIANLSNLIGMFTPSLHIEATYTNIKDARKHLERGGIDLLFLDIEMPNGGGFELLESVEHPDFLTIFVTAYNQYAIQALRMSALDYLLKPVDPDDLIKAVKRANNIEQHDLVQQYKNLVQGHKNGNFEMLAVPTSAGITLIELSKIIRFESDNNYTNIYTVDRKKPLLISKTLKHFEKALEGTFFLRVHQSHLINARKVVSYFTEGGGILRMSNDDEVVVSRAKRSMIKEYLIENNVSLG